MAFDHIAVIGGGAWGTALALTCARAGRQVTLWEQDAANAAQLANKRESLFLPGVRIDDSLPPLAHRVTVFGSTRSIAATSAGVRRRFSGLIWVLTTDGPLALGGSYTMTDSNDT